MKINALEATFHLSHAIKQHLGSQLEAKNLNIAPMHVRVLKVINKHQSCTAIDIASFFKRDKAQITRLVKQLIELDFVRKEPNPEDKRSQLLVLTPQGAALQKSLSVFSEDMQNKITKDIDAQELATFVKVAEQMTKNISSP